MKPGEIPISDAADICKKRGCAYVIIFGLRTDGERFHVTTYGMTKKLCKLAGNIGDQFADAVLQGRVVPPQEEPPDKLQDRIDKALSLAACLHGNLGGWPDCLDAKRHGARLPERCCVPCQVREALS